MRELITNNSSKIDNKKKYLFLGQWCLYNRKNLIHSNIKLFKSSIFTYSNTSKFIKKNNYLYEKYLNQLYKELNKLHNIKWSKRSWRILIGPWLLKFISTIHNRILLINDLKKKEKKFSLKTPQNLENLISYNMSDFSNKILKNDYNDLIFYKILYLKERKQIKISNPKTNQNKYINTFYHKFFNKFLHVVRRIFFLKNNFVLHKIYIGNFFTTLKIFLSLRVMPFDYSRYSDTNYNSSFPFNIKIRKKIKLKQTDSLTKILNDFLLETMPTIYLEGFKKKLLEVEHSLLPKQKTNIFTCNVFSDNIFKFWLCNQINLGSKLFYGQHGGGYHFLKDEPHEKHEIKICDKYISWGWKSEKKTIPGSIFSCISKKKYSIINRGKISIIFDVLHFFSDTNDYRHSIELDKADSQFHFNTNKLIYKFLENLKKEDKMNIFLKFHPFEKRSQFSFKKFLINKSKNFNIYKNNIKMFEIFKKSKLIIFTYFHATGFNQCMALNKPCIAFTPNASKIILKKYNKLWRDLHKVGVFHSSYKSAVKFMDQNSEDIEKWWNSKKVQSVVSVFKENHAVKNTNDLDKLIHILNTHKM